jgi:hypothetical protein
MRLNVGDLAIVTASKFYPERVGQIVTIIEPYENRLCRLPDGSQRWMLRYKVRHADGVEAAYSFRNLAPLSGAPRQDESEEAATV